MPLSEDQKALLRLLAQREQGYEDIGALMGLSVEQVRTRVREALAELGREAEVDIVPPKPVAAPPPPPPASKAPEPESRPAPSPPAPSTMRAPSQRRALSLPRDRRRLFELVGGAVVVVLFVLFATGLVDIGGDGSNSSTTKTATPPTEAATIEGKKLTQAVLEPIDGSDASGRALFGRSKETVMLLVEAKGLEPSPKGQSYAISLVRSPTERVPIAATEVNRSGTIAGQFQVSPESLGLLASGFDQMEVSLVSNATLKAALTEASKTGKAPIYSGTDVLRGKVTGPSSIVKK